MLTLHPWITTLLYLADLAIRLGLSIRVIMRKRPYGESLAWLVVILTLPLVGALAYLLFGENRLGDIRAERAEKRMGAYHKWLGTLRNRYQSPAHPFNDSYYTPVLYHSSHLTGLPVLPFNSVQIFAGTEEFFHNLTQDINQAEKSCHLEFYIWEEKGLVNEIAAALIRAAERGVVVRILIDSLGSREFLKGKMIGKMRRAGIQVVETLPVGILRIIFRRIDLRNHRKIVIIDGKIGYTGSQNLVDPRFFKQNKRVGQWQDVMLRMQGPIVEALNGTFVSDLLMETGMKPESAYEIQQMTEPAPADNTERQTCIQLVPSGPGFSPTTIHDILLTAIYTARRELILTTPYFVPDQAFINALTSASQRGVEVTLILPEKNDSLLVALASRSRYEELAAAGIRIMFFKKGFLHAKTINIDNKFSLIGTVNFDMRSFWLNFEVSLFIFDTDFTRQLRSLQEKYKKSAYPLDINLHKKRSKVKQFLENIALLVSPLL
ncbi:MAG: cardiolipin synthase [Desulfobia sp.]